MKKVAALVLCLVLMGSLFAGCQQKPKEIPPYFPHSDSIRLDVRAQDIIDLGIPSTNVITGSYSPPIPVSIEDISFKLVYMAFSSEEGSPVAGHYMNTDTELDVPAAYKQLVKHFDTIYGKGRKAENTSDWKTDFVGTEWDFSIDTGEEYRLNLDYFHLESDEKDNAPYHLSIFVARSDIM